jgi:uncharacterized protein YraI
MSIDFRIVMERVALSLLVLSIVGCTSSPTPTSSAGIQATPTTENSSNVPAGNLSATTFSPTSPPAETIVPSPTVETVVITASKGNLNIRRGPGVAYNPVSVLRNGQSVTAHGRDLLANWIMVDIPGSAGKSGWVRTETDYSRITGNITSLPEVVVDFAVPAYVQNCTYHLMVLQPGDIPVSSVRGFPDNDARVYPGEYFVYDGDLPDGPEVMTFSVKEGMLISIEVDGNSDKHKCP